MITIAERGNDEILHELPDGIHPDSEIINSTVKIGATQFNHPDEFQAYLSITESYVNIKTLKNNADLGQSFYRVGETDGFIRVGSSYVSMNRIRVLGNIGGFSDVFAAKIRGDELTIKSVHDKSWIINTGKTPLIWKQHHNGAKISFVLYPDAAIGRNTIFCYEALPDSLRHLKIYIGSGSTLVIDNLRAATGYKKGSIHIGGNSYVNIQNLRMKSDRLTIGNNCTIYNRCWAKHFMEDAEDNANIFNYEEQYLNDPVPESLVQVG